MILLVIQVIRHVVILDLHRYPSFSFLKLLPGYLFCPADY
jgi:hypothetical protein